MNTRVQQKASRPTLTPLHQIVALEAGRWRATGDDPQFRVEWPAELEPGEYRAVFELALPPGADPGLFLDLGDGWSSQSWLPLQPAAGGRHWQADLRLPASPRPARLDPMSAPGAFETGDVHLLRRSDLVAVLESLGRIADSAPAALPRAITAMRESVAVGTRAAVATAHWSDGEAVTYQAWLLAHDTPTPAMTARMRRIVDALPRRPLVSLVLPLAGIAPDLLDASLAAVVDQIYPDWELWALSASDGADAARSAVLSRHAARCSRVRPAMLPGDAPAAVLSACRGEWVGLLDDAARPAPHALLAMVAAVARRADAAMVYADADEVAADGMRVAPIFKPAWNPELAAVQDLAGPLALYAGERLRRAPVAGASDVRALFGAVSADLAPREVVHVPLLLAQRPTDSGRSHATASDAARPSPALPEPLPRVALVVPTRDQCALLSRCVDGLLASAYPRLEVVVVDNRSSEQDTLDYLARIAADPRVRILRYDQPFNYSAINNFAVSQVDADVVGLVNNDIEPIARDWLEQMLHHAVQPDVGAVGAMLYFPDDTIQHAGVIVGLGGVAGHAFARWPRGSVGPHGRLRAPQEVSAVTAACLLVRRAVYLQADGLDETLAVAFNDIDFCLRLRALGYRNVWTPHAELYHHESASRGTEDTEEKRRRFEREVLAMLERWGESLRHDPAYHPALSLETGGDHRLAAEPRLSLRHFVDRPFEIGRGTGHTAGEDIGPAANTSVRGGR